MTPRLVPALSCAALAVGLLAAPASRADDRELQAILVKAGCVPARIAVTQLSPALAAYEVTCKGGDRTMTVVCQRSSCRLQPRPRDDEER